MVDALGLSLSHGPTLSAAAHERHLGGHHVHELHVGFPRQVCHVRLTAQRAANHIGAGFFSGSFRLNARSADADVLRASRAKPHWNWAMAKATWRPARLNIVGIASCNSGIACTARPWRYSVGDGIYMLGGHLLRPADQGLVRYVGSTHHGLDGFLARHELTSYVHVFPGSSCNNHRPVSQSTTLPITAITAWLTYHSRF